jgi:hypothetical protein
MIRNYSWIPVAIAVALLFAGGCRPTSEDERAVRDARESEAEQREALRRALDGKPEESVAIKLVQSAPAAEGEGAMEQWLQRQAATNGSSIVFPRWEADRRGMGKYEVIFTCTLMREDGSVEKWGVAWSTDIILKMVAAPRPMNQSELSARASRYFRDRRRGLPPEQLNTD